MAWGAEPGRPRPMRKGNWPASRYLRPKQRLSFTPGVGRSDKRCDDALGQCLAIGNGDGEAAGKHVLHFRRSCRTQPAACAQMTCLYSRRVEGEHRGPFLTALILDLTQTEATADIFGK